MRIGYGHVIVALEIDQFFVSLGKLIGLNSKTVLNAFVFAVYALHRNRGAELVTEFKIDDFTDAVFDVALGYQARLVRVL